MTNPSYPGELFVSDVIKRAKQLIFISRDSFSDFVTASFINSEKADDLKEGIVATTNTIRRQSEITVRVDSAPGFLSLAKDKELDKLKIKLEISDPNNKNGLAIVDKAIQELEKELKILSPGGKVLTSSELAEATLTLNTRIRNRDLSAREILFSREQFSGTNLDLKDNELKNEKMTKKIDNHQYSEKSKYPKAITPLDSKAQKGDAVYLKQDGGKHTLRDKFLVLEADQTTVKLSKLLHSLDKNLPTKLSSKTIHVKQTDIFKSKLETEATLKEESDPAEDPEMHEDVEKPENIAKDPMPVWSVFSSGNEESSHGGSSMDSTDDEMEDERLTIDDDLDLDVYGFVQEGSHGEDGDSIDTHSETDNGQAGHLDIQRVPTELAHQNESESDETIAETADSVEGEHNDEETEHLNDWNDLNPSELPKQGDNIEYLDDKNGPPVVRRAVVTLMYKTVQQRYPGWVNIMNEGASKQSSIKINDYRWRILNEENENKEDSINTDNNIGPEEDTAAHEVAFHEEVPLYNPLPMPFHDVQNLESILPLTSTPSTSDAPIAHFPQRTSSVRPRGFLPMEIEDSPLGSTPKRPSRFKKALVDKAKKIHEAFSNNTAADDSSDSN